MTVAQYEAEFTRLSKFAPALVATEESRARRFEEGLRSRIKQGVEPFELETYAAVVSKALLIERGLNDAQQDRDNNQRKRYRSEPQKSQNSGGQAKKQGIQANGLQCTR